MQYFGLLIQTENITCDLFGTSKGINPVSEGKSLDWSELKASATD